MEGWYHNTWHNSGPDAVRGDICAKSLAVTEAEIPKETETEKDQQNQTTPYHDAAFKKVEA